MASGPGSASPGWVLKQNLATDFRPRFGDKRRFMIQKVLFGLYVLYCFEVGIFLLLFPWWDQWSQNSLLDIYPWLRLIMLNNFVRGAVSGLGLANLILGTWEIVHFQRYFPKT